MFDERGNKMTISLLIMKSPLYSEVPLQKDYMERVNTLNSETRHFKLLLTVGDLRQHETCLQFLKSHGHISFYVAPDTSLVCFLPHDDLCLNYEKR